MKPKQTDDYNKPVAYSTDGKPLYYHPPKESADDNKTQVVHMTRSANPEKIVVSPEIKLKHERSVKEYPNLNLSESEYVIKSVRRHFIGMVPTIAVGTFLLGLSFFMLANSNSLISKINVADKTVYYDNFISAIFLFMGLVLLGCYLSYRIFANNRFYLTNESVIQELQISLLSKKEQTVSLMNIEDTSYTQRGLIQQLFDFGSIRLSTEGDETTYLFSYVSEPKKHIATLNNAIESFKNGRPVSGD